MPIQSGAATERRRQRAARELRRVVLLRQMRGDDVHEARGVDSRQYLAPPPRCADARAARRSAASAGRDSRRSASMSRSWLHSSTSASQPDRLASTCGVRHAEVGQHAQAPRAVADDELHRLARVVRHRHRLRSRARRARTRRGCRSRRRRSCPRSAPTPRPACRTCAQTGMPWRAANAGTPPTWSECSCVTRIAASDAGLEPEPGEARRGVADAEAAIDQHARAARLDDEAVALAAAAQRREAHARRAAT